MTVKELIKELSKYPQDMDVRIEDLNSRIIEIDDVVEFNEEKFSIPLHYILIQTTD